MSAVERIAIRLPNPVGDVVAATALLRALHAARPEATLVALGSAAAAELLAGTPELEQVAVLDRKLGVRGEAAALRALAAGTVVLMPNSWSSALAARGAGIARRIGRRGRGRGLLLTDSLPPPGGPRPMPEFYAELLAPFCGDGVVPAVALTVTAEERARADARIERSGLPGSARLLAVAPGAAFGPTKIYPHDRMVAVLRWLRDQDDLVPVLLGSPAEMAALQELAAAVGPPLLFEPANPVGMGEMKALLLRCRALLSMDTGARAIAAALGVPQVVIYGPTDPRWSGFARELTTSVLRRDVSCMPCHLKRCPIDHRCMTGLAPSQVVDAVLQAVRAPRSAGP
ncbi:MAG TPA: glycosyltransferase family 9 protein [Planctomycetota bacterium]